MHRRRLLTGAGASALVATLGPWARAPRASQARHAEILIRGGRVFDGALQEPRAGDVAVGQGRILAVGDLPGWSAARTIDAGGRIVAPGFVDTHSHAGESLVRKGLHSAEALLAQGVTTLVINPDGGGPVDLARQRAAMGLLGLGVNVAPLVGHGSIRGAVLGGENRAPSPAERTRMHDLLRSALREGAFGLSSGLFYTPGAYAATDEVTDLMRVAAEVLGPSAVHTSHIRDEGTYSIGVVAAVDEIIAIAEGSGTTGIVTHMKALGPDAWGRTRECVAHVEAARRRGVAVWADQYPYEASGTSLFAALIPREAQRGGRAALATRLADPAQRAALLPQVADNIRRRGGAASLLIAFHPPDRSVEGRSLAQLAEARHVPPEEVALALVARHDTSTVSFNMSMDDIEYLMRQPWMMTCSDGATYFAGEGKPHPRGHGAFTRKLTTFVRERGTVSLTQALHSMTGLPAQVCSIAGRGRLVEGAHADVVVFDPAALRDEATYAEPHRHATGMSWVLVNGVPAIADGRSTGALAGVSLRREARRS
ncbi:N-acyl-D-amino-acid deacylase [Luteitalea sp. TBR-22]|uniref:N-acyl-D-amino-acid deacylase family protein n=1 Tax=Luteitalea sp. TBR-22 TaxID=2802971 RepID=UPI001AF67426|nr:amidohydrolase family protein [Luteitalea sp. TBR-22]BCS32096.1 N-acyl-D-amino-acid deacylase [Luteitalea sp. TBR-22]